MTYLEESKASEISFEESDINLKSKKYFKTLQMPKSNFKLMDNKEIDTDRLKNSFSIFEPPSFHLVKKEDKEDIITAKKKLKGFTSIKTSK